MRLMSCDSGHEEEVEMPKNYEGVKEQETADRHFNVQSKAGDGM